MALAVSQIRSHVERRLREHREQKSATQDYGRRIQAARHQLRDWDLQDELAVVCGADIDPCAVCRHSNWLPLTLAAGAIAKFGSSKICVECSDLLGHLSILVHGTEVLEACAEAGFDFNGVNGRGFQPFRAILAVGGLKHTDFILQHGGTVEKVTGFAREVADSTGFLADTVKLQSEFRFQPATLQDISRTRIRRHLRACATTNTSLITMVSRLRTCYPLPLRNFLLYNVQISEPVKRILEDFAQTPPEVSRFDLIFRDFHGPETCPVRCRVLRPSTCMHELLDPDQSCEKFHGESYSSCGQGILSFGKS